MSDRMIHRVFERMRLNEGALDSISLELLNRAAQDSGLKPLTDGEFALLDLDELRRGAEVEREHTSDDRVAAVIAAHHLLEFQSYYDRLEKMEKEAHADHQSGSKQNRE